MSIAISSTPPIRHRFEPRPHRPEGVKKPAQTATDATRTSEKAEEQQVSDLKRIDREVRAHEQAHVAAAGPHARGGASFELQTGPDQKQYAVSGEVQIDTSAVANDPAATIEKMRIVERAALAPARPSAQDQKVAAEARAARLQAEAELRSEPSSTDVRSETGPTRRGSFGDIATDRTTVARAHAAYRSFSGDDSAVAATLLDIAA